MAATVTEIVLDTPAPDFSLPATDGRTYALGDIAGEKGTVVVFICNHCPYVKAVIDRVAADASVLLAEGIGFAAICSNDAAQYPEDSFENMSASDARRELVEAMRAIAATGAAPKDQIPSIGCSIKWKAA